MPTMEQELQELLNHPASFPLSADAFATSESPSTQSATPDIDSLKKIEETKEQLAQVKKSLIGIIDSITDNASLVTRASNAWGEWPVWQKIGGGLVLSVPAILVGFAANIATLLIIGGATGFAYTATGMILEDHHICNVNIKQRLKEGVLGIAGVLEVTIIALDAIRLRLAEEVEQFNRENAKLSANVSNLSDKVNTLSIQIGIIIDANEYLSKSRQSLEEANRCLQESSAAQAALLEENQRNLLETISDYQRNQAMLTERMEELRVAKEAMAIEVDKTKRVSVALKKTVGTLSEAMLEQQADREHFDTKLQAFFADKETDFSQVIDRMHETQRNLDDTSGGLQVQNERHDALLRRQAEQVATLELLSANWNNRTHPAAPVSTEVQVDVSISSVSATLFSICKSKFLSTVGELKVAVVSLPINQTTPALTRGV